MDHSPYVRQIHYYETDQMAVVHHSNYIRFFEEARVDYLRRNNLDFAEIEYGMGIMFPVLDVNCRYVKSAKFNDTLYIYCRLASFTGVRFKLEYKIKFEDGSLCCEGYTTLGMLNKNYMPVSIKRKSPETYQRFCALLEADSARADF